MSIKVDKDVKKKLDDFNKSLAATAENILAAVWPVKILELQQMISNMDDPTSPLNMSGIKTHTDTTIYPPPPDATASDEPGTKKRKVSESLDVVANGSTSSVGHTAANVVGSARFTNSVHGNKRLDAVFAIVKKECEQLANSIDQVKLWVNLSMPKIEDGDNFGVQIQEEVLSELHRSQEVAYNMRDQARQSYIGRGKICSKMIKYPHIEDYTLALVEQDEKYFYMARQNLRDLRSIYAVLTDILHKNINKIRSPKGNNSAGLY